MRITVKQEHIDKLQTTCGTCPIAQALCEQAPLPNHDAWQVSETELSVSYRTATAWELLVWKLPEDIAEWIARYDDAVLGRQELPPKPLPGPLSFELPDAVYEAAKQEWRAA